MNLQERCNEYITPPLFFLPTPAYFPSKKKPFFPSSVGFSDIFPYRERFPPPIPVDICGLTAMPGGLPLVFFVVPRFSKCSFPPSFVSLQRYSNYPPTKFGMELYRSSPCVPQPCYDFFLQVRLFLAVPGLFPGPKAPGFFSFSPCCPPHRLFGSEVVPKKADLPPIDPFPSLDFF